MDMNKNVLSLAAIILTLSIGYYFVIFLPASKDAEILLSNKSLCSQIGDQALEKYKQDTISAGAKLTGLESSTNHYNLKLNKCIVEITDTSFSAGTSNNYIEIKDAAENRDLAACIWLGQTDKETNCYTVDINSNDTKLTIVQFEQLEKEYMSQ